MLHGFVCIARIQSSSFEPDPTVSRAMSTDVCNCIPRTSVGQHVSVRMRVGSERAHSTRGAGKCASRRGVRRSPGRDKGGDKALARAGASRRGEPEPEPARRWSAGSHSVPRRPPERPPHPFSLRRVAPYFSAYLPPSLFFVPLQLSPALSLSGSGSVLTGFLVVCFFLFPAPALPPRPNSRSFSVSVCFYSSISSYMCPSVSPCC